MATQVDIWNMALSSAQEKASIVSPTDNTKVANIVRLWYPTVRRRALKSGSWPCATSFKRLALLSERDDSATWDSDDPAPGYAFAYALPEKMLAPQHLHTWDRFEQVFANGAPTLVTNREDAVLKYTFDQENVNFWDEGLVLTVVSLLGAYICLNLNGKLGLADRLSSKANEIALTAQTETANEQNINYEALPPNLVARGYGGVPMQSRYFFPYENLNGVLE